MIQLPLQVKGGSGQGAVAGKGKQNRAQGGRKAGLYMSQGPQPGSNDPSDFIYKTR